jgi:hypothetical protein
LNLYVDLHMRHGYVECSGLEYGYSRFSNGIRVNGPLRQLYLNLSEEERARFGDPFDADRPGSFLEWAIRPGADGLSRFLESLYRIRYDVAAAFPDVRGRHRDAYLEWARLYGAGEMGYESELVRTSEGDATTVEEMELSSENGNAAGPSANERHALYLELVRRIRSVVENSVPGDGTVAVVSRGDEDLVALEGHQGWHFPQSEDGAYAGYYPPSSEIAIAHLEQLRQRGAQFFLLPSTAYWWLDYYGAFREHLDAFYRRLWFDDGCIIYELAPMGEDELLREEAVL